MRSHFGYPPPIRSLSALLLLLALIIPGLSRSESTPLPPHSAEYQLSRDGLPFAHMVMQLEHRSNGNYRFESRTRAHKALALVSMAVEIAPNANVTEVSNGVLKAGRYRPEGYRFQRKNADKRELRIDFDWDAMRALTTSEGRPWSMEIPRHAVDKLAVLLVLRQDLSQGTEDLSYAVADGGKLKTYRYRRVGETRISTPAGTRNSIELSRSKNGAPADYRLWLAPELHYLPVLVERRENGSLFRMELVRVETSEE